MSRCRSVGRNFLSRGFYVQRYYIGMEDASEITRRLRDNPRGVRFAELARICDRYFGEPRRRGTSHRVYRTPWQGDPRVNIQNDRGMAKAYQVRQIIKAIERENGEDEMTDRYTYRVVWSAEDEEYVGLCAEFPSLSWLSPTSEGAFSGILRLVSDCVDDMRAANEVPPNPISMGAAAESS